jgi:hypothetical protein
LTIGLEQAHIFAQNPEPIILGASCYRPEELECALGWPGRGWLPREWLWYRGAASPPRAACCGIFGGRRVDFIQHYADTAKRLVADRRNRAALRAYPGKQGQMILLEQYLLSPASNTAASANVRHFAESRCVIFSTASKTPFTRSAQPKWVSRTWPPARNAPRAWRGTLNSVCGTTCPSTTSGASIPQDSVRRL